MFPCPLYPPILAHLSMVSYQGLQNNQPQPPSSEICHRQERNTKPCHSLSSPQISWENDLRLQGQAVLPKYLSGHCVRVLRQSLADSI